MKIDLKDPKQFTVENVARLLASKDDSVNRQLRVNDEGLAYIADDYGNLNLEGVKFRFETWNPGNDYCGPQAASDKAYVNSIYRDLKCAWDQNLTGFIDYHPCID